MRKPGPLAIAAVLVVALVSGLVLVALQVAGAANRSNTAPSPTPTTPRAALRTTPPTQRVQPVPPAKPAQKPATFKGVYRFDDGVEVRVTKIARDKLAKKRPTAPGVKKGASIQTLTIEVRNRSKKNVSLAVAMRKLTYGKKQKVAHDVYGKKITSLWGSVKPGKSKKGTFGFSVPKKYINQARLTLSFSPGHGPALFNGSLDYSPGNSTGFNDVRTSSSKELSLVHHVEKSIDAAPKGSTIRIANYSFDVKSSADALLAAHKRGVHVQLIIDQHEHIVTPETRRLINALGKNRKHKSFLVRCQASCMSSRTSAMHAKFYLFSAVGGTPLVTMISSANLTHTNSQTSWNDTQTITGNAVLYNSLAKYFKDMAPDKNRPNYYRTTTTGPYKLYLFPRGRKDGGKSAILAGVLDHVTCTGAAPGFGTKDGHTIVRVGMYSWTSSRIDIARKLWKLHNKGCKVQIVYNSGRTSTAITHTLLRYSKKYGQLSLHDAWIDRNHNNSPERYMHQKMMTINGVWFGRKNTKVVYAGSQNYTPNATLDNNDLIFRNSTVSVYDDYAANFKNIMKDTPRLRHFVRGFQHDPVDPAATDTAG